MGLAETQRLLAHLYTENSLCERFFTDPEAVGLEWGLAPDDIAQVVHLSQPQVTYFARSLISKRRGEVAKLLPRTCAALGAQFIPLFGRYAETFVPSGVKKHRQDALMFGRFLEARKTDDMSCPPWLRDLIRYEIGWLSASALHTGLMVRLLRYAVHDMSDPPTARPSLACWVRLGVRGSVRHFVLSLPFGTEKSRH